MEAGDYIEEVNVNEDGGIVKKMISAGEAGTKPTQGQEVEVQYEGRLDDGTVFDASTNPGREPLKISIGTGQVIAGWDQGIMAMNLGEKADLVIKSDYGYGDAGSPPKIPGGATLTFTVELLSIDGEIPAKNKQSDEQLLELALIQKNDGNEQVGQKKFAQAEGHYKEAMTHLNLCREANEEVQKLKVVVIQNMSICLNNTGKHGEAVQQCTIAIEIDPKAVKALFQRGLANLQLKNYDEASADVKAAIILAPKDKNLRTYFDKIKAEKKKHFQTEQATMQKMFAKGLYNEKEGASNVRKFDKLPEFDQENVQVFFDIQIGDEEAGKVVFELFSKQVPKTAENFRAICTGEKGDGFHYKDNIFHRVIKGFMAQGGDITAQNGTGGKSIYGTNFDDEQIWYPHTTKGVLSMANAGPDTNGSQFFILFGATPHLNEKHTVYGRVIKGYDVIEKVEANPTAPGDKPVMEVKVADCGELKGDDKLNEEQADFLDNYLPEVTMDDDYPGHVHHPGCRH